VLGDPPLSHPGLVPLAYLQACAHELAGRGGGGGGFRARELADREWRRALAERRPSTSSTEISTGARGR
jgi:hypothetical protein